MLARSSCGLSGPLSICVASSFGLDLGSDSLVFRLLQQKQKARAATERRVPVTPTVAPIMTARLFEGGGIGVDEATGEFDEASGGSEMVRLWRAFKVDADADEKTDDDDRCGEVKLIEETSKFEDVLDICEVDKSGTPMVVIAVAFPIKRKAPPGPPIKLQSQIPSTPSSLSCVRVPFKVPQQYVFSVVWSQLSIPRAARDLSVHPYSVANLRVCLRAKPTKQKAGHADERQFRSVQLPRP